MGVSRTSFVIALSCVHLAAASAVAEEPPNTEPGAEQKPAELEPTRVGPGGRVALEAAFGAVGIGVGFVGTAVTLSAAGGGVPVIVLALSMPMAGAIGGVYLGGTLARGDGALWTTAVGAVVGGVVLAVPIAVYIDAHSRPALNGTALALVGLALVGPIVGGILGYELSHGVRTASGRVSIAPDVRVDRDGTPRPAIGVVATF